MNELAQLLPLILIVAAFWFLVIRPGRKKQQQTAKLQASLAVGSEVMLGSGIFGTVVAIIDDNLQLEVAPGTVVKVARAAVVHVVQPVDVDAVDRTPEGPDSTDEHTN